ncbi:taurine ABC transporter substrate-binding protein [Citrobacter freundii]|nr:taurine ABC transporter substrate-binding protein [Citrobacter freundii]
MAISSRNALLGALAFIAFQAQAVNVTVAYQTSAEPAKVAQADNTFAKESGATVDWRKFDSGASIVRALASGDVQIGNLGSSPLAVAASQQVPIEVFLLASKLGNSEALVVKKNISKPEDLIGKRIAVPFISTTHYSLLAALKHWGIKPGQVEIVNLQPPAIIAAWQRGDIDGAYVWAPAVNALEKDGKVLTDSSQVGEWGAPTLDVWVVRKDFAEKHPEVVKAFAKSAIDAQQPYIANPDEWLKQPENISKLSRLSGVPEADVPGLVKGNTYLTLDSGELLVVLGPSGCGKTTLLNLIAGFVPYQHGSITLAGNRVDGPGADRGVVFQNEGLLPWRNVQDNVAFGLQLAGVDKPQRQRIALEMLQKVGLEDAGKRFIWQLSGGQRQRVGIARALAANPQLLLLDEPFGALDAFTREQMQTLLLKLWHETGKQVLLITHDIEEAVFMATELVLLSPGPGRVLERLPLNFARRFVAGESSRSIKSDPQFIAMREYVLGRVFEQREAFS